MEQQQGVIHRTEITDNDGVTWAVRHELGDRSNASGGRVSHIEFSAGERLLRGRIAGGSRVGADSYKAVLADAKQSEDQLRSR